MSATEARIPDDFEAARGSKPTKIDVVKDHSPALPTLPRDELSAILNQVAQDGEALRAVDDLRALLDPEA